MRTLGVPNLQFRCLKLGQKNNLAYSLQSSALQCMHVHRIKHTLISQKYKVNLDRVQCKDVRKNSKAYRGVQTSLFRGFKLGPKN